ncbi:MAG: CinA family nicotinamide mononucleotide deamidase-related protein, partial [Armatimonadetes bacterium]|nr:CinA family nicotinamide mononucleotide deamidase-related protein [Anaerolineae bacterium]
MVKDNINAEVISIGTEILLGELTDTNSVYIAKQLRDIGINLYFMTSVGDNRARIADAIRIALGRAQVVITCGGLGPTIDDMTRQAAADATDRGLIFDQTLLDQIEARFKRFGVKMTDNNRRQAYLPAGAMVIENPVGTAPCFSIEQGAGVVISLPGVPREMQYLMGESVVPYLRTRYNLGMIKARILKTAGIGESMLDELIGVDLLEMSNPTIGLAAHNGQVDVRITAKAEDDDAVNHMIAALEATLQARIGEYVFGYDQDTLERVFTDALNAQSATLAICEAGIGKAVYDSVSGTDTKVIAQSYRFEHPDEVRAWVESDVPSLRELAILACRKLQTTTDARVQIAILSLPATGEDADSAEATAVCV